MWYANAITLVLISLFCNGCNDFIFKKYSAKTRSRGVMIAGAGFVWGLWQCFYLHFFHSGISLDPVTVKYGLTAGLILVLANILLLESLTHLQISLGATIYRLNTIGVVIFSYVFLGEHMGLFKLTAIALGIFSVLLLFDPSSGKADRQTYSVFLLIVMAASLLRASYGVFSKFAINHGASIQGMIPYTAFCWVVGGLLYAALVEKRLRLTGKKMIYMLISGTLIFFTVATLLQAISLDDVSTIIPIANCSFIVALTLSVFLKVERINMRKLLAITIAVCSVIMLSRV